MAKGGGERGVGEECVHAGMVGVGKEYVRGERVLKEE